MPVGLGGARRGGLEHRVRSPQRWRLALAVGLCVLGLSACGSSAHRAHRRAPATVDGITGALPPVGTPTRGGTIRVGQLTGQTPTDIFPLADSASCTTPTLNFIQNQYIPLYAGPDGATPAVNEGLSAAEPPRYSDADRTVTITLKPGLRWSDGKPVQVLDVVFYLDLLKAALHETSTNWCQYSPGQFPDDVAAFTTAGPRTLVLHLAHPVNPRWFTSDQLQDVGAGVYPLPSQDWDVAAADGPHLTDWATNPADAQRIYDYLHAQGLDMATFAANPLWKVVDGPFQLRDFSSATGAYDLVPNPDYGLRPRPRAADIAVGTYAGASALLRALQDSALDIASIPSGAELRAIPALRRRGFSVFGGPEWGWFGGVVNYRDATDHFGQVIAQPYMRGVFAELVDQAAIIRRVYHGWAVAAHGPVPTEPRSPYVSVAAGRDPWPYDPARAVATLRAHGWTVRPGGLTTCQRAGSATGECGAGIPAGTPVSLVWANVDSASSTVGVQESEIFAAEARHVAGIQVRFVRGRFGFLTADYNDQNPAAGAYVNDWGINNFGGVYTDYYPTQEGLLSLGGTLNLGGYEDPVANRLMAASVLSPSRRAIDREVSYLSRNYPVLYMPDEDWIMAVSRRVGGPAIAFRAMTQQQQPFQFLYLRRRRR
jgi:peptide/nickel transport system substrate-binding protein